MSGYRLWVNAERTLMVREWESGEVEIVERDNPHMTWEPPIQSDVLPTWIGNLQEEAMD